MTSPDVLGLTKLKQGQEIFCGYTTMGQDVFLAYRRTSKRYDQAPPETFSGTCL